MSEQEKKASQQTNSVLAEQVVQPVNASSVAQQTIPQVNASSNASPASTSFEDKLIGEFGEGTQKYLAAQIIVGQVRENPKILIDDDKLAQQFKIEKATIQSVKSQLRRIGFPIEKNPHKKNLQAPQTTGLTVSEASKQTGLTGLTAPANLTGKLVGETIPENSSQQASQQTIPANPSPTSNSIIAQKDTQQTIQNPKETQQMPPVSIDVDKLAELVTQKVGERFDLQPKAKKEVQPVSNPAEKPVKPQRNDGDEDAKRDDKIAERVSEKIMQKLMGGSKEKTEDGVIQEEVEITGDRIKWSGFIDPEVWMRYNIFKAVSLQQGKKWEGTLGDFFNIATRDVITSHGYYPTVIRTKGNKALIEFPINQDEESS